MCGRCRFEGIPELETPIGDDRSLRPDDGVCNDDLAGETPLERLFVVGG